MSVQAALSFIQRLRTDRALREQIGQDGLSPDALEQVQQAAERAGYSCTIEDLRTAFKHDWGLRWLHTRHKG